MLEAIVNIFLTYFLRKLPKRKFILVVIIIITLFILSVFGGKKKYEYRKERNTYNEMIEIQNDIIDYKNKEGRLPNNLDDLIRNNPLKSGWLKDDWNNDYLYEITNSSKQYFILKSIGKDHINPKDDIILTSNHQIN